MPWEEYGRDPLEDSVVWASDIDAFHAAIEAWEARCAQLIEFLNRCEEALQKQIDECDCQYGESWHRAIEAKIPASEGGHGPG